MVKKADKNVSNENESYEKLRDELFEYRVDIKSYKRSMNTLIAAASVVMTFLAFFGYNRIEAIHDEVEARANARLAKTDSLLAMVDMRYLDSLTDVVNERTLLYEEAITALERGTRATAFVQHHLRACRQRRHRYTDAIPRHTPRFLICERVSSR